MGDDRQLFRGTLVISALGVLGFLAAASWSYFKADESRDLGETYREKYEAARKDCTRKYGHQAACEATDHFDIEKRKAWERSDAYVRKVYVYFNSAFVFPVFCMIVFYGVRLVSSGKLRHLLVRQKEKDDA